ncbi:Hypothetical protein NGAL_HAMBI2610_36180 [Neorhizobium galegae bv. orientalis]|nr:Hypothetical protein NGAL_HAMBI2610_36180 [Neorhizobium galegae bv. orientalis]
MHDSFRIVRTVFDWAYGLYRLPDRVRYPNRIELDFAIQLQEQSNWCWAATASSISHHYEPNASVSQNEIVGRALGVRPPWIPDESWNRSAPMMTGLRIVRCDAGTQRNSASFRRILKELDRNNPICVQIKWPTKQGHAVVITGGWIAEDGSEHYIVGDPGFGDSFPVPGDELHLDYLEFGGEWVQTYFVRAPY